MIPNQDNKRGQTYSLWTPLASSCAILVFVLFYVSTCKHVPVVSAKMCEVYFRLYLPKPMQNKTCPSAMSLLQCILNKRNVQQADIKKSKHFWLLWKGFCELHQPTSIFEVFFGNQSARWHWTKILAPERFDPTCSMLTTLSAKYQQKFCANGFATVGLLIDCWSKLVVASILHGYSQAHVSGTFLLVDSVVTSV